MKPSARGFAVEDLAVHLLEDLGFEVRERRKRVLVEGVEVAEVDIIATRGGELYAVEVKSGKISVSDVRQAYANAALLNAKPLIVCRGFSDESSEKAARALGVEVLVMDDYLAFTRPEELYKVVEAAICRLLTVLLSTRLALVRGEDLAILKALAYSVTFKEAAEKLGVTEGELGKAVADLRRRGVLTVTGRYDLLRLQALVVVAALASSLGERSRGASA